MRKSTIVNGCLYLVLTTALLWLVLVEANPAKDKLYAEFGRWLGENVLADPEVEAAVAQRRLALERFQSAARKAEAALYAGDLELAEAVERILVAWRQEFPDPAGDIAPFEPGDTEQERLAGAIVRQIEHNERLRHDQELRERLQAQLADMLKKRPKTPQPGLTVSMA